MADPVLLLPGSILPASLAYAGLLPLLAGREAVAKELDLYGSDAPPPGWSLATESDGLLREAEARGWDVFHLVGYSGGASACLDLVTRAPERVRSLAVLEPPWVGRWGWSEAHQELWRRYEAMTGLPEAEYVRAFQAIQVRDGVTLPPPPDGPPPPWMAQRPAGTLALLETFRTRDLPRDALAAYGRPVLYVLGGLSNPVQFEENAERLAATFPDFTLEVYDDRHHFDPPRRSEPERLAAALEELWQRAER